MIKNAPIARVALTLLVTGGLFLALSACQKQEKPQLAISKSTDKVASTSWEMPTDPEAKAYLANCEVTFNQVEAIYARLRSGLVVSDAKLLDELNEMDRIMDGELNRAGLFANVHPNKAYREASEACEQHFVGLISDIGMSRPIYDALARVDLTRLTGEDRRYLEHMLRDFRRSGVDKDESTRERIKSLNEEINLIGQEFDKNYREGGTQIELSSIDELAGLPQDYIEKHKPNEAGKILVSTDTPDYMPLMQYATNDAVREKAYKAYRNMAYPKNKEVLERLMQKRFELASILGYNNYASYVTEDKMIKSPENAQKFIDQVSTLAGPKAQQEYQVLLKRLQKINPKATVVSDWQKMYLEKLIMKEKFQIDAQQIRQYFPFVKVQQGIFDLTQTLFGVTIKPWDTAVWHPDVKAFEIWENEKVIGRFYLDLHPRDGKYKHAAQFGIQSGLKGRQVPVAALVCNFPGATDPNELMEHDDVETFLHEFGHLLHNMFSGEHDRIAFSGVKTEWDFVEAPSQMLEEWVWDASTLASFAKNTKGEVIPRSLVNKMRSSRDFGRGLWTKHQLFYAALSLNIYNNDPKNIDIDALMQNIQSKYSPFGYVEGTHFYASFGHLNGYSAIYYTYMWSLVIASDMFSEFEKNGLRNPVIAKHYRETVLGPGGSKDAADLVQDFLGRPYSFETFAKKLEKTK